MKFHLKLDTDSLSMYRDVKAAIARILEVEVYALQLYSIEDGCVELVFVCPGIAASLPLNDKQREHLFRIRPPVLKMMLVEDSEIDTVLFEVHV